ncbi:uncharacterized protein LOC100843963 isoform X2 [Brachypodium distachyon]|nr:uncharacterized protein LOC100843963 isoform X2 [Brachypodium distachyon]XP_014754659.1 uncharacterized protein LOC100843963 isoform X2 [Brachypodium distachyon]XP_014754660.1 uncharacterized protein LOC100843963 isoform X2 [Brachypodium distachyon]XP_014754661.1 uncharacterized protein LOC100843963 isoform X2 [Brachypodium distachyon]XP_014754663.1 uncharacterized protein LOC100843963 isoform X2 [Brachypodium distachyon]XP_024314984.1 uncharacterized protein LOC100843963 isoform X2 [Brachy|eukprot:XP_014754658.1 uncharacterized protein LOC100843963 isoform X2 [Brachypodium distachyon]
MAAPAPAPDLYSMVDDLKESIFFVRMIPKGREAYNKISSLADKVLSIVGEDEREAACNAADHCATGFTVGTVGEGQRQKILILTCAHMIEHIFQAGRWPIDVSAINSLYDIEIYCPHSELLWISQGGQGRRTCFKAVASFINCRTDLLMLTARVSQIALRTERVDGGRRPVPCSTPHPELHVGTMIQPGKPCLLLSWPSNFLHLVCQGLQCDLRRIDIISSNTVGYDMSVLEAQIGSKAGSSGAPLFNAAGDVIGILHGGFNGPHSYFVAPQHIEDFIAAAREAATAAAAAVATEESTSSGEKPGAAVEDKLMAAQKNWSGCRRKRSG